MSMNAAARVGDPVGHRVIQSLFGEAQAARRRSMIPPANAPRRPAIATLRLEICNGCV